jgi:hypothetical protein
MEYVKYLNNINNQDINESKIIAYTKRKHNEVNNNSLSIIKNKFK